MTGSHRSSVPLLAAAIVAATTAGSVASASHVGAATPSKTGLNAEIHQITVAPKSTDAWAISNNFKSGSNLSDSIIRLHKGKWSKVALKRVPKGTYLNGIAAGSSKRIWAAGDRYVAATSSYVPVLTISTGGPFKPMSIKGLTAGRLLAVAASSKSNAWLVAENDATNLNTVFHWNGHKWKNAHVPTSAIGNFGQASISTTSASNVWLSARGTASTSLHWNGHVWAEILVPAADTATGIATTGARAWISGYASGSPTQPIALRLSGKKWKPFTIATSSALGLFDGVAATGATAYAVGHRNIDADYNAVPIVYRLHGKSATFVKSNAVPKFSALHGVAVSTKLAIAGGDFEKVGYCKSPFHPLAEILGKKLWKQSKIPAKVAPASNSGGVACG